MTKNIKQALQVLTALGFPRAQLNERSALCLLALLDLTRDKPWSDAAAPLMGITPIMDWARVNYRKKYAPNTRETIRRQTMHQFVDAGVAVYNPDDPARPVNSPPRRLSDRKRGFSPIAHIRFPRMEREPSDLLGKTACSVREERQAASASTDSG